jgi:hypothetical protein
VYPFKELEMISAKRLSSKANEHRRVQHKRGANRQRKFYAGWMKKCAALVGFLGTFAGVLVTLLGPPGQWFERPDTKIIPDDQLSVVNVDGEQFEFQLALTMINEGHKTDTVRRPHVSFTSDRPIVKCSREVVFKDKQGDVAFPVILPKEPSAQLLCIIKWKPSADYYLWTSSESAGTQENKTVVLGRIALTWPGGNPQPIELPFALLAAETIRDMKPSVPLTVNYLYLDGDPQDVGDRTAHNTAPSRFLFGLQDLSYRAAGIEMGGAVPIASTGMPASPVQAAKSHDAVKGEVASGKEISSANPNEVIVNIRPCGGAAELVVFKAQFKKRFLGSLPCGVQIVQVEKL